MNIEIGVGIGKGLVIAQQYDRLYAYSWATVLNPSVSTISSVSRTVNGISANASVASLLPQIANTQNVSLVVAIVSSNADVVNPVVLSVRNIIINEPIGEIMTAGISPNLSNAQNADVAGMVGIVDSLSLTPFVDVVRNPSILSVVGNTESSAQAPSVSVGGGSSYYLQMDGVDDNLYVPSMPFTKVEIDGLFNPTTLSAAYIFDGTLWSRYNSSGSLSSTGSTTKTGFIIGIRTLFTANSTIGEVTAASQFYGSSRGRISGNIHNIKIYNGATLQAHYDMATGTVQDQSGNGNHATLTGGTWVVA